MLNLIDKNLLIAVLEKAIDFIHLRAEITSLDDIETALVALRSAYDADPDAVTAEQIEAVLVLMENAKFPSLKYISWAFPFWATPGAPVESLLSWLSAHLLWDLITGKPSTFPPDTHTHAQYLESVGWADVTGKPSTFPPASHDHDDDYVSLSQGIGVMGASWSGNNATSRTINLSYNIRITTPLLIILMSWLNASTYGLRLWSNIFSAGYFYVISNTGCSVDASQWTFSGGTSIDIVQNINQTSWYYRLFMLGWRSV